VGSSRVDGKDETSLGDSLYEVGEWKWRINVYIFQVSSLEGASEVLKSIGLTRSSGKVNRSIWVVAK
jgi:hypothetical protein